MFCEPSTRIILVFQLELFYNRQYIQGAKVTHFYQPKSGTYKTVKNYLSKK